MKECMVDMDMESAMKSDFSFAVRMLMEKYREKKGGFTFGIY